MEHNKLEKMSDFFENRLATYDVHMLNNIEGAKEFYPFTAKCLPQKSGTKLLDLGCGTGLELEFYFKHCPDAQVTCIDLAQGMLEELKRKFEEKFLKIIQGSYFDVPLENNYYDAVVSVESLHHYTKPEKIPLYKKIYNTLSDGGYFILTDYFASSDEDEALFRQQLTQIKSTCGITDQEIYHYDTPLTVEHECSALSEAGFKTTEILNSWANTYTIKASK